MVEIGAIVDYLRLASRFRGRSSDYKKYSDIILFLVSSKGNAITYINPFSEILPNKTALRRFHGKKSLSYSDIAAISAELRSIWKARIDDLFDAKAIENPDYSSQKQRLQDLKNVNFIPHADFVDCCRKLNEVFVALENQNWYEYFKEKQRGNGEEFFKAFEAFEVTRKPNKYTLPAEYDRDRKDPPLSSLSPGELDALLQLEDDEHSYSECYRIIMLFGNYIRKTAGGEVENLTENFNLLKLFMSFKYTRSAKGKSALSRYIVLLIATGALDITPRQWYGVMEFLDVFPTFLQKRDLVAYIHSLSQSYYSLYKCFEDLKPENDTLLYQYITGRDIADNSSEIDEKTYKIQEDEQINYIEKHGQLPLNKSQLCAIKTALTSRVSIIQGPPGTGKTHTILNMASIIYRCGKTAAIVSSNNAAIDSIVEKIDSTVLKGKLAPLGNKTKCIAFNKMFGTPLKKYYNGYGKPLKSAEEFLSEFPIVSSTIHSLSNLFTNSKEYLFDYIIIDEASQADVLLGTIVMALAKNVVFVGDDCQLPPVFIESEKALYEELGKGERIPEHLRLDRRELSILGSCTMVFLKAASEDLFLAEHYRCHPSIIGFCREYVYVNKDSPDSRKLQIKSAGFPGECRISIRWYRGDYAESCRKTAHGGSNTSKRNMRQVRIFIEEEWDDLLRTIASKDNCSIAIMSPYVGQIEAVEFAIKKEIHRRGLRNLSLGKEILSDGKSESVDNNYHTLTIHKAQGSEFDIVYILPVDDSDYEWPFAQKKRLVNVAVSRAKEELRIITSTNMMSRKACEHLSVQYCPTKAHDEIEAEDELFFQKLIDYVLFLTKENGNKPILNEYKLKNKSIIRRRFGFIPCKDKKSCEIRERCEFRHSCDIKESIFDEIPERTGVFGESKPESIFVEKVERIARKYGYVSKKVSLRECLGNIAIVESYHFDCAFFKNGKLKLAVEIDGEPHRSASYNGELINYLRNDREKDEIVRNNGGRLLKYHDPVPTLSTGERFYFLRIPTDGTTWNEIEKVEEIFQELQISEVQNG